jgi:hypothetical protein
MHEEDDQVPPGLCLPKSRIDIFTPPVTFFNKAEVWAVLKHLSDFFSPDAMFLDEFLNDVLKPDEACDFQGCFLDSKVKERFERFRLGRIFPEAGSFLPLPNAKAHPPPEARSEGAARYERSRNAGL